MCNNATNYYIYSYCSDPSLHYFKTDIDTDYVNEPCAEAHERYIIELIPCPLCALDPNSPQEVPLL